MRISDWSSDVCSSDLQILMELLAIVLAGEPARIPGPVDAQAQTDRIDLLTHQFDSSAASARSRTMTVRLLKGFSHGAPRPRARACERRTPHARPTVAPATWSRHTSN